MEQINSFINKYLTTLHIPTRIVWTDIVEIIIISFLVYQILIWIRDTKAWNLLKGVIVILIFLLFAALLRLSTILWIAEKVFSVGIIAVVIVLQPELRRALEQLGQKNFVANLMPFDTKTSDGIFPIRPSMKLSRQALKWEGQNRSPDCNREKPEADRIRADRNCSGCRCNQPAAD